MHVLKLVDCLEDKPKVLPVKTQKTTVETTARDQAEEEKKRQKFTVWCELVQYLDKDSTSFDSASQ